MADTFHLEIFDPLIRRVGIVKGLKNFSLTRHVNQIGTGQIDSSLNAINPRWLSKDYIFVPMKSIDGAQPIPIDQTAWFLTGYTDSLDTNEVSLQVEDSNSLLRRRIIAYAAASAEASKTGISDNLAKAIVRENMGALATDTARRLDSAYFTVAADLTLGTSVNIAAAHAYVIDALRDIAKQSEENGVFLAFDVVYTPGAGFEFRTYIGQRGMDRRSGVSKVLIGPQYGNIQGGQVSYDWSGEVNASYAGGQGEEDQRLIGLAIDTQRATMTPWARREGFTNAFQSKTQASVDAAAKRALRQGQPKGRFVGNFVSTRAVRYGVHVNYGDFVAIDVRGDTFESRFNAVQHTLTNGVYAVTCAIENGQTYG